MSRSANKGERRPFRAEVLGYPQCTGFGATGRRGHSRRAPPVHPATRWPSAWPCPKWRKTTPSAFGSHAVRGHARPGVSCVQPVSWGEDVCRNIKTLFNFEPPATEEEIRDASLQFVRKLSGFNHPPRSTRWHLNRAVEDIAAAASSLIASLITTACPRDREIEAARARARSAERFGTSR